MLMKVTVTKKKVKNLTIHVVDCENIAVTAPIDMPNKQVEDFLIKKKSWIEHKLGIKRDIKENNIDLFSFNSLLVAGKIYKIVTGEVPNICCIDGKIILPSKKAVSNDAISSELSRYILQLAKSSLPKYVSFWGTKMSLCPSSIKIKRMKSKWGSCNGDGEIVLNSRLVQLPLELCEYVIVHELCHLKHLDHSEAFWHSVASYLMDYSERRTKLKQYDFLTTL